jgi:hypothetical protein
MIGIVIFSVHDPTEPIVIRAEIGYQSDNLQLTYDQVTLISSHQALQEMHILDFTIPEEKKIV